MSSYPGCHLFPAVGVGKSLVSNTPLDELTGSLGVSLNLLAPKGRRVGAVPFLCVSIVVPTNIDEDSVYQA